MKITVRDINILEFLNTMDVGDLDVITAYFFSSFKSSRRRVKKLSDVKLIQKKPVQNVNGYSSFLITKSGYNLYKSNTKNHIIPAQTKNKVNPFSEHTRHLSIIRTVLKSETKYKKWFSERELLRELSGDDLDDYRTHTPDGIYIDNDGKKCSVEYELSRKSKKRLEEKINDHKGLLDKKIIDKSVFISKERSVLNALKSLSNGLNYFEFHEFSTFENKYKCLIESLSK